MENIHRGTRQSSLNTTLDTCSCKKPASSCRYNHSISAELLQGWTWFCHRPLLSSMLLTNDELGWAKQALPWKWVQHSITRVMNCVKKSESKTLWSHQDGNRQQQSNFQLSAPGILSLYRAAHISAQTEGQNPTSSFSGPGTHQIHTHVLYPLCCYSQGNHKKLEREQEQRFKQTFFKRKNEEKGTRRHSTEQEPQPFLSKAPACLFLPESSYTLGESRGFSLVRRKHLFIGMHVISHC